jgi:hypothetical protein
MFFTKARLQAIVTGWLLDQCEKARRRQSSLCDERQSVFVFIDSIERTSEGDLSLNLRVADTSTEAAKAYKGTLSFKQGAVPAVVPAVPAVPAIDLGVIDDETA